MRTMVSVLAFWVVAACAGAGCSFTEPLDVSDHSTVQEGVASYYGHEFHGRLTANGEVYDENKLTAAHPSLPFGTRVQVINLANDRYVVLRINDRGPFVEGRIIDVSYRAANDLGFVRAGLTQVRLLVLEFGS